jgi:hypothetical protein
MSSMSTLFTGLIRFASPVPVTHFAAGISFALVLLTAGTVHTQNGSPTSHPPFPQPVNPSVSGLDDRSEPDPAEAARRVKLLNVMRQKALVSDTNKLLKLAGEFDAEIHKSESDSLTPDQLHRLATIEKLARSIKEKMSMPVAELPSYQPPSAPIMH